MSCTYIAALSCYVSMPCILCSDDPLEKQTDSQKAKLVFMPLPCMQLVIFCAFLLGIQHARFLCLFRLVNTKCTNQECLRTKALYLL